MSSSAIDVVDFDEMLSPLRFDHASGVLSLLDQTERRDRIFYTPDRNAAVTRIERSKKHPGQWITLTVSGSF